MKHTTVWQMLGNNSSSRKTTTAAWEQVENFIAMATYDKKSTILNNNKIKIWIIILSLVLLILVHEVMCQINDGLRTT